MNSNATPERSAPEDSETEESNNRLASRVRESTFQTVTLDVSGSAPLAPTFLVMGETTGSLSLTLLGDTLDLGILPPMED